MTSCAHGRRPRYTSNGLHEVRAETSAYLAGHSDHTYSIRPACDLGGHALCAEPATCNIEGHAGFLYNVYEDARPIRWTGRPA